MLDKSSVEVIRKLLLSTYYYPQAAPTVSACMSTLMSIVYSAKKNKHRKVKKGEEIYAITIIQFNMYKVFE